ncbi:Fic family protein [Hymenobacter sp.]|uniref:Fic family protein n=1 Tax=Hymenobacter sp. TaxID=1898978 RepID=UPI00286ACBF9|nr:Fic family protein [Hymenobacter sp.]
MPLFTDITRLKADLDVLRPLAPEQEQRVLQKFRLEWNYNSNAIEGNSLTLGETRSLLLHGLTAAGKPMRDHLDIKGHNEAVLWLEDFVRSQEPLTEHFVRSMHQLLLGEAYYTPAQTATGQATRKMIVPGQYKQQPNNVLTATGEMFYFASPEETPARMTDLVDWYRQEDSAPTMHPVALAAEFHYRFVRIHPFDDGNGRMSRLLMNLILLRHSYPMTVIKADDRNRYLAALAEADAGEPEPFLRFIIDNVEAGLRLMIRAAKGESIDEPDDLGKKWALLKKQVLTQEQASVTAWGLTLQTQFYQILLENWITDLAAQVEQANELFAVYGVRFVWHEPDLDYNSSQVGTWKDTLDFAEKSFARARNAFDKVFFVLNWGGFKDNRVVLNLRLSIEYKFLPDNFKVAYRIGEATSIDDSTWPVVFQSFYKPTYDHVRIHEINYKLANKVYDFIAAKVAEADTSPS